MLKPHPMKKKIIFTLFCIGMMLGSKAQLDKGSWMLGGEIGLNSARSASSFYLSPKVGYFFANKLALGLGLGYTHTSNDFFSTDIANVSPFFRAYLKLGNFNIFPQVHVDYSNNGDTGMLGAGGGVGLGLFLNDNVSLEGIFDYSVPDFDNTDYAPFTFRLGLQVYFPKK